MIRDNEESTELSALLVYETRKAILIQEAEQLPEIWLPKKAINELKRQNTKAGVIVTLEVGYKLAREKGLV